MPDPIIMTQLINVSKLFSDEHLHALRRARCGVCGKIQLSRQMRLATSNNDIMEVLLCCLVLHDQISVETAIELYISCGYVIRRICHEHFVFVVSDGLHTFLKFASGVEIY